MSAQDGDKSTYEIGLVMAGAVSAGAYAAGVVDFLIETLGEWHRAKRERPEEVPDHEVCLKVVAGSSAGGMTGAIAAGTLNGDHTPVTSLPGDRPDEEVQQANKLYSAWVDQIDIHPLLGNRDLSGSDATVHSLLDASILEDIAETAIDFGSREKKRAYVADPMSLILTVTNLKGVPYDISFQGNQGVPHKTARHTDYKEFALGRTEPDEGEALWLNARDPTAPEWDTLREYALATGPFPGGLAPRSLRRKRDDYDHRGWKVPPRPNGDAPNQCWTRRSIIPSWSASVQEEEEYQFLAVDGGAMNNEPFELARQRLAGEEGYNPRSPDKATRSVLMVDPFPSGPEIGRGTGAEDVFSVLQSLFGSLMTQARFKPDEVMLANPPDVYSRYMIVPTRRNRDEKVGARPRVRPAQRILRVLKERISDARLSAGAPKLPAVSAKPLRHSHVRLRRQSRLSALQPGGANPVFGRDRRGGRDADHFPRRLHGAGGAPARLEAPSDE